MSSNLLWAIEAVVTVYIMLPKCVRRWTLEHDAMIDWWPHTFIVSEKYPVYAIINQSCLVDCAGRCENKSGAQART